MKKSKSISIRLSEEHLNALKTIANIEGRSVSSIIRRMITESLRRKEKNNDEN